MTIAAMKPATWAYSENFVGEDDVLTDARARAAAYPAPPVGPGVGAALRFLAATLDARNVVEIGTGFGISGTWLLRGMRRDGVLTSVDVEAEHQRFARQTFTAGGFAPQRARLITGAALDVLSRLTDGHYDLVFCDGDKKEYAEYLVAAARLLRVGGVLVFNDALGHDKVADPSARDPETTIVREVGRSIVDSEDWLGLMLPIGDGLLSAVKRA
jgi:predicted O-methyltransferase YrrM